MKIRFHSAIAGFAAVSLSLAATPAYSVPTLQVDIAGGTYDPVTETIVTANETFTVRAWLSPKQQNATELLSSSYVISMAIAPMVGSGFNPDNSSFVFDGQTINVTEDMEYGVPPLEDYVLHDPGDLPKHGVFETYFAEWEFHFDESAEYKKVNVQDDPGAALMTGTGSYVVQFTVDVSGLSGSVNGKQIGVHFDLYNKTIDPVDVDVDKFAPFSHDAEYRPPSIVFSDEIPEPASFAVWGVLGAVAAAFRVRRRRAKG